MKTKVFKLLVLVIIGIFSHSVSYASQPSTNLVALQQTNSSRVTLSLTLYQQLICKSPTEILRYLKKQGCILQELPNQSSYWVKVKGGFINVFMKKPEWGVAPVLFCTKDKNVRAAWIRSLKKQGFETDNYGNWYGVNGHWPSFRIADIKNGTLLFLKSYPLKYNPKTNSYE